MTTFNKLTAYVSAYEAQACADAIQACEEPAPLAVTAFEDRASGGWVAEAYFDGGVALDELGAALAAIEGVTGRAVRCDYSAYPNVQRWVNNMKALKTWPKVHEAIDGFAASMKDKQFVAI